jgi:hypothetical protein
MKTKNRNQKVMEQINEDLFCRLYCPRPRYFLRICIFEHRKCREKLKEMEEIYGVDGYNFWRMREIDTED